MSSSFSMQIEGERVVLQGELTFASVLFALNQTAGLLSQSGNWTFDLSGIDRIDSAGLSLLLEWLRRARKEGGRLTYIHLPKQLQAIAKVVGVENFIFTD